MRLTLQKAHKLQGRLKFRGLDVSIENRKGSIRRWKDLDAGDKAYGETKMLVPYGYIRGTLGNDGDHIDVFVGPDEDAPNVFIIDQRKAPDFKRFDEQKVMLGFRTAAEAKAMYLRHYDKPDFFGSMKSMPFEEFRQKVHAASPQQKLILKARTPILPPPGPNSETYTRDIQSESGGSLSRPAEGRSSRSTSRPGARSGGWTPIPGSAKGGLRRRKGSRYEYKYPEQATKETVRPPKVRVEKSGEVLVGKMFQSKADADSQAARLGLQSPNKPPGGGWQPIPRGSKGGYRKMSGGKWIYWYPDTGSTSATPRPETGWLSTAVTQLQLPDPGGRRLPVFGGSRAKPGTALYELENGYYGVKEVKETRTTASGRASTTTRLSPVIPDHAKTKLLAEFRGAIVNAAKRAAKLFGVPARYSVNDDGKRQNETLLDLQATAMEGVLRAMNAYQGGAPFAPFAQQYAEDYARLHAAREFAGVTLPRRHVRMLASYIAAKAQARATLGREPTTDDVLSVWRPKKGDLHDGLDPEQAAQAIPPEQYRLGAEPYHPGGDKEARRKYRAKDAAKPGKRYWAEQYEGFLDGQNEDQGAAFVAEDRALFPALGIGSGLGPDDKILIRRSLGKVFDTLAKFEYTPEGRKKITYRSDVGRMIRMQLGLDGDGSEQSIAEIAASVPIFRQVKGEWKQLAPRQAAEIAKGMIEEGLEEARSRLNGRAGRLVEQAQERLSPPATAPHGPTWFQAVESRARKVGVAEVREWRAKERTRLRALADTIEKRAAAAANPKDKEHQSSLAEATRRAAANIDKLSNKDVARRIAQQAAPATAEMRRAMTRSVAVEAAPDPNVTRLGDWIAEIRDPSTGKVRYVRMRRTTGSTDPMQGTVSGTITKSQTAGDDLTLTSGMLIQLMHWPELTKLLVTENPAAQHSEYRAQIEELLGMR